MASVQELLRQARDLPGDSPARDAEILLCHCLGKTRSWLYAWPESVLTADQLASFEALLSRRRDGEPVAYLTGRREFWSLDLKVDNSTLIPRPETETLVEWALSLSLPADARVLDLGTGTGAIALALASERPGWRLSGLDISAEAVALATANARENGLERVSFTASNWFAAVSGQQFHLLVSNPPYIEANDPHLRQGDVRFEPATALVSGEDGLADIRQLIASAPGYLVDGGWLLLEHGYDQGAAVGALLQGRGFSEVASQSDLAGHSRITGGQWHAQ